MVLLNPSVVLWWPDDERGVLAIFNSMKDYEAALNSPEMKKQLDDFMRGNVKTLL